MKKSLVLIIVILFTISFGLNIFGEDTKLRITLNVNGHGRSVRVTLNDIKIKKVIGGQAQAIQLYHRNHPLLKGAPKDYIDNFCLKEGKNTIKIVHHLKKGESPMPLDISIQAIGYDLPLLKYVQKADVKSGETSGVFELYSKQPKGFSTIILK